MKLLLSEEIRNKGMITTKCRRQYFGGMNQNEIRDMLERIGIDRHVTIEYLVAEIAIQTPQGLLLQVSPEDDGRIALWSDILKEGETPVNGAIRLLKEQLGVEISSIDLKFVDTEYYRHEFANKDKVFLNAFRYTVRVKSVPKTTNYDYYPVLINRTFREDQQEFVDRLLHEKK